MAFANDGVDGGTLSCQHLLVSSFTCTAHCDLVWLLSAPITALEGQCAPGCCITIAAECLVPNNITPTKFNAESKVETTRS